ncbi:MAG: hypothetical protein D6814_07700, partial [Calditrichaeota bacterium]
MPNQMLESPDQFRKELIRRFFHPKSYFFLCLSTQLQDISNIAKDVTEDDYFIIGQLMQHLIDADDPSEELKKLQVLDRFNDFHFTLQEALNHLHQPGLAPEDMKQTIEGLANDFVEVTIDVIHDAVQKKRLIHIITQETPSSEELAPPQEDASLTQLNESVVENLEQKPATLDKPETGGSLQPPEAVSAGDSEGAETQTIDAFAAPSKLSKDAFT